MTLQPPAPTVPTVPPPATMHRRSRRLIGIAAGALAVAAVTGCSAAQDAAQDAAAGAQDAASAKVSAKASELAVEAARAQLCNLVKDGSVSAADAAALDGLVAAGQKAGVPEPVLAAARVVADQGKAATGPQVADLKAKACAGGTADGGTTS
jgi:hypothetical protein